MKPNRKLAETTTPDGARLILYEHDGSYCIRLNGQDLMHSRVTASELRLGELAAETLSGQPDSLVLLGGMGLGFTLKSLLARSGPAVKVQVAELIPQIIDWNRNLLAHLNGALLEDPRVEVLLRDVWTAIASAEPARYDALVLDVDNGPTAMVQKQNARLYSFKGLQQIAQGAQTPRTRPLLVRPSRPRLRPTVGPRWLQGRSRPRPPLRRRQTLCGQHLRGGQMTSPYQSVGW